MGKTAGLYPCHDYGGNQVISYTITIIIIKLIHSHTFRFVLFSKEWTLTVAGSIKHDSMCLSPTDYSSMSLIIMKPCDSATDEVSKLKVYRTINRYLVDLPNYFLNNLKTNKTFE